MFQRSVGLVLLISIGIASISGCSSRPSFLTLDDGSVVFMGEAYNGAANDILLSGTIEVIEGKCLGINDGRNVNVLVVQNGSKVSPDASAFVTPEGLTVRVGDVVSGGDGTGGLQGDASITVLRTLRPTCFEGRDVKAVNISSVE